MVTKINITNIKYMEKVTPFFTLCFLFLIRKKCDFPQPPEVAFNKLSLQERSLSNLILYLKFKVCTFRLQMCASMLL